MKRILIDVDDTIANFSLAIETAWRKRHPDLPYIDSSTQEDWKSEMLYEKLLGKEAGAEIAEIYSSESFYDDVPPIAGFVNAMNEMLAEGHDVRMCTSYVRGSPHMLGGKVRWIERHLGSEWENRVILTRDKTAIVGDILVDDSLRVRGACTPTWKQVVFDRPHNKNSDLPRLTDWREWRSIV